MNTGRMMAGALAVVLLASPAGAQTHDERFRQAFGDEANKVAKTAPRLDDIELAERILKTATEPGDPAPFRAFLCRKATDLAACDATGCSVIRQSGCLCAALEPNEAGAALRSATTAFDALYRRTSGAERAFVAGFLVEAMVEEADRVLADGNSTQAVADYKKAADLARAASPGWATILDWRLARAQALQHVDAQIAQLRKTLDADPKNAKAATELVNLQLTGKDDPSAAAQTAKAHELAGEFLSNLELAATEPNQLNEAQALALCEWYRQQAKGCAGRAKETMLRRARICCLRFLVLQGHKGTQIAKGEMALDEIGKELLPLSGKNSDGWLDLLTLADSERDDVRGSGRGALQGEALVVYDTVILPPYQPPGEYDMLVSFTREAGNDAIYLRGIISDRRFRCVLGGLSNTKAGLERIKKSYEIDSPKNPTVRALSLVNGRRYVATVQVRAKGIRVLIDGVPLIEYLSDGSDFPEKDNIVAGIFALGVGSYYSKVRFYDVRARPLAGEGKIIARQPELK
jgi:hypothetical protein